MYSRQQNVPNQKNAEKPMSRCFMVKVATVRFRENFPEKLKYGGEGRAGPIYIFKNERK